jgi:AcrR family transcriptional regulator
MPVHVLKIKKGEVIHRPNLFFALSLSNNYVSAVNTLYEYFFIFFQRYLFIAQYDKVMYMTGITIPLTKRGQETFLRIYHAAEQLFHTQGYHSTTIADIAAKAGVAVGTFYLYSEDKYALYKKILTDYSHIIRQTIASAIQSAINRKEKERLGMKAFITYVRDHPHVYTIIWQSLQVDKELFINYYKDFARHYQKALEHSYHKQQLKKYDLLTLAYTLMGIANFVGLQVIMFEDGLSQTKTIDTIVDEVILMLDQGIFIE